MSFSFGSNPTQPTTGLTLGQPQQQQQQQGFGFGVPQTQSGFQLGTTNPAFGFGAGTQIAPTAVAAPTPGFAFGAPAAAAPTGGLSFGTPTPAFGLPSATTSTANTFGFGSSISSNAPTSGFAFGQPAAPASTGLSFGQAAAPASVGTTAFGNTFGIPATPAAPAAPTSSIFGTGGFSFGTTAPAPQYGAQATSVANAPATPAFSFSNPAAPATSTSSLFGGTGFTLGSAAPTTQPVAQSPFGQSTVFPGFGTTPVASVAPVSAAPSMPLLSGATPSFGATPVAPVQSSETPATTQTGFFSFGTPAAPNTSAPPSYSVGLTAQVPATTTLMPKITPAPSTGFSAPSAFTISTPGVTSTSAPSSGLSFGTPGASKITLTGFTPTATTTSTAVLTFGTLPTASSTTASTTATAPTLMTAATTAASSMPSFSLGTSPFTAPKMATPAATTAASIAPLTTNLTTTSTPTPVTGFTTGSLSSLLTTSTAVSTTTAATVTDSAGSSVLSQPGGTSSQLTFRQLEEAINKWNLELSDQERIFLNQATQVNAWDRLLITNGEKIKGLHESVERVKLEQERLDHELDFIVSQQRELEELLTPLEKTLDDTPALSIQQHADLQREHTYHMAEKVDCQLKRMADDIKQIIEHLNTTQNQDDTDPMQQVSKILNAHMDALQWVDQNTDLLQKKLEELSKVMDATKKDQEQSWRISYN